MILKRFYEDTLAQASYLIGCAASGEAIVVDPNRDVAQYIDAARREGLRITAVTETHIHADFVSGARALALQTGATLYVSGEGGTDWQYEFQTERNVRLLHAGDSIRIGNVRLDALHTPGHTPEHLTFLLTDEPASSIFLGAFTGDFLFVGEVGRPDLLEKVAGQVGTMKHSAQSLYRSLAQLSQYPPHLLIWPGHGAGSACGKNLGGVPVSSLGYERHSNWALQAISASAFAARVLEDQPEPPRYFARMKQVNRQGMPAWSAKKEEPVKLGAEVLQQTDDKKSLLIDLRPSAEFAAGHIQNSLSLPYGKTFTTWAGSLLDETELLVLIAEDAHQAANAARALALIGIDLVVGWIEASALTYPATSKRHLNQLKRIDPHEIPQRLSSGSVLMDVRGAAERKHGYIPKSMHIPLGDLQTSTIDLPRATPIVVHCQSGTRSPIAASVLRRMGFTNVEDLAGGFSGYEQLHLPVAITDE